MLSAKNFVMSGLRVTKSQINNLNGLLPAGTLPSEVSGFISVLITHYASRPHVSSPRYPFHCSYRWHHLLAEPGEAEAEDQGQAEGAVAGADDRAGALLDIPDRIAVLGWLMDHMGHG